jgi:UDP-N-acetylmuramoyl-L-alanyl-D-glutamate--2,6-diaminopimelate ligase
MRLADLAQLVEGAELLQSSSVEVRGIAHDSRSVKPGDLFVCLIGEKFDGHRFIQDAIARGAVALAVQPGNIDGLLHLPLVVVPNTRTALPKFACAVYNYPSRKLKLIGVTGTNGKTTSTFLMASILKSAGLKTGTVGTLGAEAMGEELPSDRTTPEADQLQGLLSEMLTRGAQAVAMEVSSHALDQGRTEGCEYDAAIFTNLTQDHLDYHRTMEAYMASKLRLFHDYPANSRKPFVAAINLDDPYGNRVVDATRGRKITFAVNTQANIVARNVNISPGSIAFQADTPSGAIPIKLNIGGAFQISNALGAIAAAQGIGIANSAIEAGLSELKSVPGRFEDISTDRGFHVVVDYAHSPDGLENLISAARRLEPKRIIVVFGCGGDRDRTKRPIMGRIVGERADVAIITSDNPRSESPDAIITEILPGLRNAPAKTIVEPDRRTAISMALSEARDGDIVLIAGKGHEDYQEVNGVKHHFDDREVARELLGQAA